MEDKTMEKEKGTMVDTNREEEKTVKNDPDRVAREKALSECEAILREAGLKYAIYIKGKEYSSTAVHAPLHGIVTFICHLYDERPIIEGEVAIRRLIKLNAK